MEDFPSQAPVWLHDHLDVSALVTYLRSSARHRPVLLLTIDQHQTAPYISVNAAADAAAKQADVVVIPNDDLTRAFSEAVGTEAAVYRGACRVYPPGDLWETHPHAVPLRLARTATEIASLPRYVFEDLKHAIRTASQVVPKLAPTSKPVGLVPLVPTAPVPVPRPTTPLAKPVPEKIETEADAKALSDYLFSARRAFPVLVVSRAAGATEATADVGQLRRELKGLADICEITTLGASWAFAHLVPEMCQVYGGAGRVYPIGREWSVDVYQSPLRLAYGPQDRTSLTRQLISDTMSLASRGSYATQISACATHAVSGEVKGVAAGRGLVQLDNGDNAVVWPELTQPDLPAERLFARGMKIQGQLDPESHRVDVRAMRQEPLAAVAAYRPGDSILARIATVSPTVCTLELFPGLDVDLPAQDISDDPNTDLRDLMSDGETVAVLIVAHDNEDWLLSIADAAEMSAVKPAVSILIGGPPWLVPPAPEPLPTRSNVVGSGTESPALVQPGASSEVEQGLRLENLQLSELLQQAQQLITELTSQLALSKTGRREGQRRSRADRQANKQRRDEADHSLFLSESDQLGFEIRLAWARRIPPADKQAWPLKPWSYSDQFFTTLRALPGTSQDGLRDKIVDVIVDVLTGRDAGLISRERHMLRTGSGGDDPPRTRNGGETCWRVSIQVNTPQAHRLHYWKCNDGSIELASVRRHDDFAT